MSSLQFQVGDRVRFSGSHATGELGTVVGHSSAGTPRVQPDRDEVLNEWDSERPRERGFVQTRQIKLVEEEPDLMLEAALRGLGPS